MAEYQKYMFDNFVIEKNTEPKKLPDFQPEPEPVEEIEPVEENIAVFEPEPVEEATVETVAEVVEETVEIIPEPELEPESKEIFEPEAESEPEPVVTETKYSEEELAEAVKKASNEAYERGFAAAADENAKQQNILLEDIKNQLMMIFSELDAKKNELETSSLKFAVESVRKVLPTLEKERAEAEVKTFLAENFANFSMQESLSFAFHPDTVSLVASSIGRLAEQNDFEGKIAVHKDQTLGLSDCRVEWKNGGVERNTAKVINKIEGLIKDNTQERENG